MAEHIDGPLYYETMGKSGPVMAFVHPNPMDQSCWIFQMAQMSTLYRCIAIDLPGYGKSPKARAGLTMQDIAQACWEAIADAVLLISLDARGDELLLRVVAGAAHDQRRGLLRAVVVHPDQHR